MSVIDPQNLARALGGEASGNNVRAPGPGHKSPRDRSLSVKLDPRAPDGFVVHSFAGDDPIECRDHVARKGDSASSSQAARSATAVSRNAKSSRSIFTGTKPTHCFIRSSDSSRRTSDSDDQMAAAGGFTSSAMSGASHIAFQNWRNFLMRPCLSAKARRMQTASPL